MGKIYIVTSLYEEADTATIECAYTSKHAAQRKMMELLNEEIRTICECEGIEDVPNVPLNTTEEYNCGGFGKNYIYEYNDKAATLGCYFSIYIEECTLYEE